MKSKSFGGTRKLNRMHTDSHAHYRIFIIQWSIEMYVFAE